MLDISIESVQLFEIPKFHCGTFVPQILDLPENISTYKPITDWLIVIVGAIISDQIYIIIIFISFFASSTWVW